MKNKIFSIAILVITLFSSHKIAAQVENPVQFHFSEGRDSKGAFISIKGKIQQGVLFSTKKQMNDVFNSSVLFDSASKKLLSDSLIEKGTVITSTEDATGGLTVQYFKDSVEWVQRLNLAPGDSATIKGKIIWLAWQGEMFPSGENKFSVKVPAATPAANTNESEPEAESGIWSIFLLCLGTGLLAVFTPCVFPLIPVTVSYFLKKSKTRGEGISNAVWYSLSIILIYTIPTLLITLISGPNALYKLSTHPVTNLFFFAIFIIFGISLLGAFELTLPNSWANKTDEKAGKGGKMGIFFMALTLVIVSFSCTGPIVGLLLGQTSTQGVSLAPVMGMLGFGLGLALPFSLFAFFPSMLKSLPKSGGWLNTVKVTFGFIELALAMKFLSNVDLAYHWRLLDREIFLVIWIVIFVLLGFYLLGKLKFSHDSDLPYVSVPRLFFAITVFSFALYMVPGLWGAPLRGIGGWVPHTGTQDFNLQNIQYQIEDLQKNGNTGTGNTSKALPPKKLAEKLHGPLGITTYFDLEEGMAAAKALNKPVMLDFTGHSCANCRKMEAEVWSDPEVLQSLKEDFVIISLYVDESTTLPEAEQYKDKSGDLITTVGGKNLDYEITKFGFNAQPLYMFLDLEGTPMSNEKMGYVSKDKFLGHLKNMKAKFEASNK